MGELCQQLFLASSTVTDLIDRMEKNELVQRVRDPEDRRVVRLVVRDRGRRVYDEVMRERQHYLRCILDRIPPGDRERLAAALSQVHELMTGEEAGRR
jgi:DNA-binding MarR family transcriptional regulator